MTTKSYYLRHFLSNHWLEPIEGASKWRELLHPDFQAISLGMETGQYLPLLWSVTVWQVQNENSLDPKLQIKTSPDEALLTAIDLRDLKNEDFAEGAQDDQENAESLFKNLESKAELAFNQPATNVPLKPIRAVQEFLTEFQESNTTSRNHEDLFHHQDLWTWGIGACPGHGSSPDVRDFLDWLMEPEHLALLTPDDKMGLTLTSADHLQNESLRPSNLRRFNLERLRRRELSWTLSAAWEDLFFQKASR